MESSVKTKDKIQIAMLQESYLDDSEHAKLNKMGFESVYFKIKKTQSF